VLAFALNAPFGLRNAYDEAGPQRYITTDISLTTLYLGPYVGWQATPAIAIGGGLQYVYASADISQRINYGGFLNPALNENPTYDGALDVKDATDNAFAANVGILVKPLDSLQIGATWRSGIDLDLSGEVNLTMPAIVTQLSGGLMQSLSIDGASTISLPQTAGFGVAFQALEALTLVGDFNWINWSVYESLDFDFSPDVLYLPDTESPRNWDDSIAVRFGAEYWLSEQYAVRAGYLYDQSPIPDNTLGPELPGANRHGLSVGFGYKGQQLSVDLAYSHLFLEDRTVTSSLRESAPPVGDYEAAANIFGISVGYAF
jgi:long-chain fatty acid transport protein